MNNPYSSPDSNLSSNNDAESLGISIRKHLIIAWAVLVCFSAFQLLPMMATYSRDILVLSILFTLAKSAFAVLSIYYLRGAVVVDKKPPYSKSLLGWFGFAWRAYLSILMSIIPLAIFAVLFMERGSESTVPKTIITGIVQLFSIILIAWLLFSNDRMGQLKRGLFLFRGW